MLEGERLSWIAYYDQFPFDDLHRYHRPAAMVATAMAGGDLQARLEWLQPEPTPAGFSDVDLSVMRRFGFTKKG